MAFTLFKPNKAQKGAILSASFTAKADKGNEKGDKSFYFRMTGQTSWDEKKRRGGFKDGPSIVAKMAPVEIAGIVQAIRRNISLDAAMNQEYIYHDGEKNATIISFKPNFKREKVDDEWKSTGPQRGFAMRITRKDKGDGGNSQTLTVGLTFAEAELFSQFLQDGLVHVFNAWRSEEIAAYKAAVDAKRSAPRPEPEREAVPAGGVEDDDDVSF